MGNFIPLKPRQNNEFTFRLSFFLFFCYFIILVIFITFFYLQIVKSDYYLSLAEGNTEQKYPIIPPRGLIYDRNGVLIAKNRSAYQLSIIPAYLPKNPVERKKKLQEISQRFDILIENITSKINANLNSYRPLLLKENLEKSKIIYLEEHKDLFPYLSLIEYSARIYPFGESLSHVLGYVGIISPDELAEKNKKKEKGYRRDSIIGKNGIEKEYDKILRGIEGESVKIVNSLGKPIRELTEKNIPAIAGKNVVLSIDANLQDIAYNILYGKKGAIIISKPNTGELLALVSSPGFDANLFFNPDNRRQIFLKLLKNPDKPFLNRAIQGRYPCGSIFKIVTAIAGLEDEKVNPYEKVFCKKTFELGDRVFKDLKMHGNINLLEALEKSSNVYFYQLGYNLGYASILEYATQLGLDRLTQIDIPGELPGFIPTPEWKEKRFKEPWYDGDTVNASIGQGFIILTPLAANNIISAIAAGKIYDYRLLWKIQNPYTGIIEHAYEPNILTKLQFKKSTLEIIREALRLVPISGTAQYHKYLSEIPIAGKTGSAQNVQSKRTHSWFISYGPLNKSLPEQYAITVMVETVGHGGSVAVPIASILYNLIEGKTDREKALKTIYEIFRYQETRGEETVQD